MGLFVRQLRRFTPLGLRSSEVGIFHAHWAVRGFGIGANSHLQQKLRLVQQAAMDQVAAYQASLSEPVDPKEADPILHRKHEIVRNKTFGNSQSFEKKPHNFDNVDPKSETDKHSGNEMSETEEASFYDNVFTPSSVLQEVVIDNFGSMAVRHGDIFAAKSECVIIPMVPNVMPYRGIGLEALERGGKPLIREVFASAKSRISDKMSAVNKIKGDLLDPEMGGGPDVLKKVMEECEHLSCGDVLFSQSHGTFPNAKLLAFCIMPYYWQGGPTEAARKLRWCFSRFLSEVSDREISSVALPHIGMGLYGYDVCHSSTVMLETAVEHLLQVEQLGPNYSLKQIEFVDLERETASVLAESLQNVMRIWLPEYQILPAPVYWAKKTRRLIMVTPWVVRRFNRVKKLAYKKHHGIIRNRRLNYEGNVKPFLWRAARCHEPPPHMVLRETGKSADFQLPARPFYERGVSQTLFPRRSSGFNSLRVTPKGKFAGINKHPRNSHVHPRPKQY